MATDYDLDQFFTYLRFFTYFKVFITLLENTAAFRKVDAQVSFCFYHSLNTKKDRTFVSTYVAKRKAVYIFSRQSRLIIVLNKRHTPSEQSSQFSIGPNRYGRLAKVNKYENACTIVLIINAHS